MKPMQIPTNRMYSTSGTSSMSSAVPESAHVPSASSVNTGTTQDKRIVTQVVNPIGVDIAMLPTHIHTDETSISKGKLLHDSILAQLNAYAGIENKFAQLTHILSENESIFKNESELLCVLNQLFPDSQVMFPNINGFSEEAEAFITFILFEATYREYIDVVTVLLDRGANVNAADLNGINLLIASSAIGLCPMIELLLDRGARIDGDSEGFGTPLLHAIIQKRMDSIRVLIGRGADVNACMHDGRTLLMSAQASNVEAIPLLIAHGANVNAQDRFGLTPLILATKDTTIETLELFLNNGALIDQADYDNKTPLMYAVCGKHIAAIRLLLSRGADKSLKDRFGRTALELASIHIGDDALLKAVQALLV